MGDEERAEDDDDVVVEQGGHHELQPTDDLQQLRQRKDELTQKHLDQQHRKQQLKVVVNFWFLYFISSSIKFIIWFWQAILRERVQVELEVRPKYLVADTNCYIDHLNALVRLAREKHYTIVAPLVGKFSQKNI